MILCSAFFNTLFLSLSHWWTISWVELDVLLLQNVWLRIIFLFNVLFVFLKLCNVLVKKRITRSDQLVLFCIIRLGVFLGLRSLLTNWHIGVPIYYFLVEIFTVRFVLIHVFLSMNHAFNLVVKMERHSDWTYFFLLKDSFLPPISVIETRISWEQLILGPWLLIYFSKLEHVLLSILHLLY